MINSFTLVTVLIANTFLTIGLYVLKNNPNRKFSFIMGSTCLLVTAYFLCTAIAKNSSTEGQFVFWTKMTGVIALLGVSMWLQGTLIYKGFYTKVREYEYWIIYLSYFIAFILAVTSITTDLYVQSDPADYVGNFYTNWYAHATYFTFLWVIYTITATGISVVNILFVDGKQIVGGSSFKFKMVTIGGTLSFFIAGIFIGLGTLFSSRLGFPLAAVGEVIALIPILILTFFLDHSDVFIEDQVIFHKQSKALYATSMFWVVFYFLFLYFLSPEFGQEYLPALIGPMVVVTFMTADSFQRLVSEYLLTPKVKVKDISPGEINFIIKNFNRASVLETLALTQVKVLTSKAHNNSTTEVDALRGLIREAIVSFEPKDNTNSRTRRRVKYEILRMMTFEGAKESAILWDLGFECHSVNKSLDAKPRFPLRSNSEYSSVSIPSFRRVKQEALEDLAWRMKKLLGDK